MTVLEEILEWSQDRPAWQRDALRRLVQNGELAEGDIAEFTEICKSAHGLVEQLEADPLTRVHLPEQSAGSAPVTLSSIFHHRGVNALAENQTLRFSPHLTIVYGDNAAGKTGYIRIFKSACYARGPEHILGNVTSLTTPFKPEVSIKYRVGAEEDLREWSGAGGDDFISHVSVFDTQSAAVYLTEKTDVAFRPFGLDLFDKLVKACKLVQSRLERERIGLISNRLTTVQAQVPEGTAAARLLTGITSLTKPETVLALTRVSSDDEARISLLEKSLLDLQANDPEILAQQLTLLAGRVGALALHLKEVEKVLSTDAVKAVLDARNENRRKTEEASRLRAATFSAGVLKGTGSDLWSRLWESAREFSQEMVYRDQSFPVVDNGAQCLLCQQDLDHYAVDRLKQFEAFVASTTERELREIRENFGQLRDRLVVLQTTNETIDATVNEIRIENETIAAAIATAIVNNEKRRQAITTALISDAEVGADCLEMTAVSDKAEALAKQLHDRASTLRGSSTAEAKMQLTTEVKELRARKVLSLHEQLILEEIDRKKRIAAYELCLNDTRTAAITQKSTSVTRTVVTKKLKESFQDELSRLAFRHVEVELRDVGGAEGVLYHKLVLTRAPGLDVPKVVSEGEQRCLSIAAFFAELSTADDSSGIVFDDPVSSLDYKWREGVAHRLVQEA